MRPAVVARQKPKLPSYGSALRMLKSLAVCLALSVMSGCAQPRIACASYSPVLLSEAERACLSQPVKDTILLNNLSWIRAHD